MIIGALCVLHNASAWHVVVTTEGLVLCFVASQKGAPCSLAWEDMISLGNYMCSVCKADL